MRARITNSDFHAYMKDEMSLKEIPGAWESGTHRAGAVTKGTSGGGVKIEVSGNPQSRPSLHRAGAFIEVNRGSNSYFMEGCSKVIGLLPMIVGGALFL